MPTEHTGGVVGGGLRIDLFGRLVVRGDGRELAVRGERRRALLARLAVTPGRVVASGQLETDVWGADTPPAPTTLPTQIFRLRRDLGDHAGVLVQRDDGYALDIPGDAVDVVTFADLVTTGFPTLEGEALRHRLRETLAMWSGPALEEFVDHPWAREEGARLEALALSALERCIELELELGRHDTLVPELTALVDAHPYRERLWSALMLALYRTGRQRDALDAVQRLRRLLRDELGIAPGSAVAELERRMLVQDPSLAAAPVAPGARTHVALVVRAAPTATRDAVLQSFRDAAYAGGGEVLANELAVPRPVLAVSAGFPDAATAASTAVGFYDRINDDADVGVGVAESARTATALAAAVSGVAADAATSAELVREAAVGVESAGSHRLLDLAPPRAISRLITRRSFNVTPARIETDTNLPVTFASLVGRAGDVESLHELVAPGRVITLLGPGGVGKTRLALEVAAGQTLIHPGGVWLVELDTTAPTDVGAAVAMVFGVAGGTNATAALIDALGQRPPVVLVLDCCDTVAPEVCTLVEDLLERVAELAIIVTSREPLRSRAEHVFAVRPLDASSPDSPAATLFTERARQAAADLALTPSTREHIAAICQRLDGLPLAIELAALRLVDVNVAELAAGLDRALGAVAEGPRTAVQRQQTLSASLAWGHDLLDDASRLTLERLSVFPGRFEADDVTALWGDDVAVEPLVERGLVRASDGGFRLLDTVREFAAERLEERGETAAARDRHLDWVAAWAGRIHDAGRGWKALGAREADAALAMEWSLERGRFDDGVTIALALQHWWMSRSYSQARLWFGRFLDVPLDRSLRIGALSAASVVALVSTDFAGAIAECEEALLLLAPGPSNERGALLNTMAAANYQLGDVETAERLFDEALPMLRADPTAGTKLGTTLCNLGILLHERRDIDGAAGHYEEAMAVLRVAGDRAMLSRACANAGTLYAENGDPARAVALYREAIDLAAADDDLVGAAIAHINLANVFGAEGNFDAARDSAVRAIELATDVGMDIVDAGLSLLAEVAIAQRDFEQALVLLRACSADPKPELWEAIHSELGAHADELWAAPPVPVEELLEQQR